MNFTKNNNGIITWIDTNIPFKTLNKDKERFLQLLNVLADEFIKMELYEGDKLLKYGEDNDIYNGNSHLLFKHSNGTALIRALSFGYKKENGYRTEISPAVKVSSPTSSGWVFDTGAFADVYFLDGLHGELSLRTRDTLKIHNLFLHWVISELEKRFNDYKLNDEYKPLNNDVLAIYELTKPICLEFDEYISRNKSKRIDTLIVDDVHIHSYIKDNIKYRYITSEEDIYKCAMIYGKPYNQIKKYLEKVLS